MVISPDGRVHAQTELKREELLIAEVDVDLATQAMFKFDLEGCADLLFADTVKREEYASALEVSPHPDSPAKRKK
jgi:hypothetical protein